MKKDLEAGLIHIVRGDPELMAILAAIQDLPDCRLVSGCIYQTVWNVLTGRARGYGIKDYDVAYFDACDLSWEAEDRIVQSMARLLPAFASRLEVRNQARVHLWYEQRFGRPYLPLKNTDESIDRYASIANMVGIRLDRRGDFDLYAPGLEDIFALRLRPNRAFESRETYLAKAARQSAIWTELTVEPW
jgi:uncharacterized protein